MRHGIARIIAVLGGVMLGVYAAWEVLEAIVWGGGAPTVFYLVRGTSTAILMAVLAAWLMARYRRGYEDILRRQSAEANQTRQFFEHIVQDAGEGIVSLDREGRVRFWNRAAETIYGYPAAEIMGHTLHRLVPADLQDEGELERIDEAVVRRGFVRDVETRRMRKDGSIRRVRISRSALRDEQGGVVGSTAIVSDVTAEREMESRLVQAERLAAIGEAGASIAHEVRNALAGISGAVQILRRSPAWRDLPEGFAEEIDAQVGRMARIVDDLLLCTRPGRIHPQPTDLHRMLRSVVESAAGGNDGFGKSVRTEFTGDDFVADVDPAWIEQAFHNLALNAFQAMQPGGVLRVSTRRRDGTLEVEFTDDGPGMELDVQRRAFEPFFTTKARGSGLGLPIVQTIIEAHSGSVVLREAPGGGTAVILELPAAPERRRAEGATMATSAKKAGAGAVTVLALMGLAISAALGADAEYVGDAKCKMCHKAEHASWAAEPHARAMEVLSDAEKSKPECLGCHATGYGKPGAPATVLAGVQCESCHGPGSLYKSPKLMSKAKYAADPDAAHKEALELGLIEPDEATCRACHNDRSPTFKGFDYSAALEKIRHGE